VREPGNAGNQGAFVLKEFGRGLLTVLLIGAATTVTGCGVDGAALDEAYARGYSDGAASVQQEPPAGGSYAQGYQDGVAETLGKDADDACQRCYGLGFAEGYDAGFSAAAEQAAD
jgi:hypothetical protein